MKGSDFWELLDGTKQGKCREGSVLMEMAMRILGIPAEYQFVHPAAWLPVPVETATQKPKLHSRPHPTPEDPDEREGLFMFFFHAGQDFTGWNWGEGCCMVDGKLYTAWAKRIVGEPQGKRSAAHHVLLQLEELVNMKWPLQWWILSGIPPNGESAPIPDVPEE